MAVGVSTAADERAAVAEAVRAAMGEAGPPDLVLVLSTIGYAPALVAVAANEALGAVPWAGCCAAGVFAGRLLLRRGIVVGAIWSGARVGIGVAHLVDDDGRIAGAHAAAEALEGFPPGPPPGCSRALVLLANPAVGSVADVLRGALEIAGAGVVWAGGDAADPSDAAAPATFAHGQTHSDSVVVIALDAPVPLAAGLCHGFQPYGPPTMVTRAVGAVAAELEYQAAFPVYQRAARARGDAVDLATFPAFAMNHPLGIPRADGQHVIRDPIGVDPDGGLRCLAEVPDGSLVRVMEGDRARLLGAARSAITSARRGVAGPLAGALVFDCVSRAQMLGAGFNDELAIFAAEIGDAPLCGCLTFGEIGALGQGTPQFHNKTAVVLALGQ
jgi:hypothetical protein